MHVRLLNSDDNQRTSNTVTGNHNLIPNPGQVGSKEVAREYVKLHATGIFHAPILLPESISLSYALLSKRDEYEQRSYQSLSSKAQI